jgi:hypothetical protein
MNPNTIYHYSQFLIDDDDDDDDDDDVLDKSKKGIMLDTEWITKYETDNLIDEYKLFLEKDITCVSFEFFYLDRSKKCLECIVPMTYSLRGYNQITQDEIFSIVQSHQKRNKKYYNFQSLLLYNFQFQDNNKDLVRWVSEYLQNTDLNIDKVLVEYTNILSIDVIHFCPVISMFHDLIGFSVLLYED